MEQLKENPWAKFEDKADVSVPAATLEIYKFISEYYAENKSNNVARCSAATMCVKRNQFQRQGTEGTPLTPRKQVNFLLGALTERAVLFYITHACVGEGKLYSEVDFGTKVGEIEYNGKPLEFYEQPETSFEIDGLKITGHADGWGRRHDGVWELIEIKSSANWGFDEFKRQGAGDYLKQSHAMMMTDLAKSRNVTQVRFFYLRKETGHLWDRVHDFDQAIADSVIAEFKAAQSDAFIKAPHALKPEMTGRAPNKKPTGRRCAGFPCTYCPFLRQCHGEYKVEWSDGQFGVSSPKYIFG